MTDKRTPPDKIPTAAAVEAVVHAIEAKEAAAEAPPAAPAIKAPIAPIPPAPPPIRGAEDKWSLPQRPVAQRPVSMALRGPIPGLIDRQLWEALIVHEAQRQLRYGQSTAIVLAELDGLDALVERMGPAAVNRLVPSCAGLLVSLSRASDRVARLATGRFGVLLFETDAQGAARYAARATTASDRWLASSPWNVQLSFGWTATTDPDELRRAMRAAEEHLRTRRS